ncbi:hypothetical protein LQ939_08475 [Pantoea alhagi]|uniref:hypothetical protein n=1 Tax=Pantoea alhagi TaxID=1891675 RepID=UPI00202B3DD7|nr:hypothetical protein [Pantoea alhagi]URQ62673.1 hypothetical protein LQ939_08475 [Pantoea alhagi]
MAQLRQKVHSKEQIIASGDSGGKSQSQHSQFGLNSSMAASTAMISTRNDIGTEARKKKHVLFLQQKIRPPEGGLVQLTK